MTEVESRSPSTLLIELTGGPGSRVRQLRQARAANDANLISTYQDAAPAVGYSMQLSQQLNIDSTAQCSVLTSAVNRLNTFDVRGAHFVPPVPSRLQCLCLHRRSRIANNAQGGLKALIRIIRRHPHPTSLALLSAQSLLGSLGHWPSNQY